MSAAMASSAGYRTTWRGNNALDEAATNLLRSLQAINDDDSDDGGSPRHANGGRQPAARHMADSSPFLDSSRRVMGDAACGRSSSVALSYQGSPSDAAGNRHSSPTRPRHLASSSSAPAFNRGRTGGQGNDRFRSTGYSVLGDAGSAMQAPQKTPAREHFVQEHTSSPQFSALRESMGGRAVQNHVTFRDDTSRTRSNRAQGDSELQKVKEELNGLKMIHSKTVEELAKARKEIMRAQAEWQPRDRRSTEDRGLGEELARMRRECDGLKRELDASRQGHSEFKRLRAQHDELNAGLAQERQRVKRIEQERSKLKDTCEALSASLEAQGQEISHHRQQSQELTTELEQMRRQGVDTSSHDQLLKENQRLKAETQEQQTRHRRHKREVTDKLQELQRRFCEEQQKMQEENDRLKAELEEKESAMQRAEDESKAQNSKSPSRAAAKLEKENKCLQAEVHERLWALKRSESEQEKNLQGYSNFIDCVSASSASPVLDQLFDLSGAELLGMGSYGYVMTCKQRNSEETVVLKLQSTRCLNVAVKEWNHGSGLTHPNIAEFKQVLLHRDVDRGIEQRLRAGFDNSILTGRRPDVFPDTYICTVLEFMECGTIGSLIEKNLLSLNGVAAVARQVSCALAFMHKSKRTHNDIKPENLLLRQAPDGTHLVVKLADLGLAAHSVDRTRDVDLFAYTIWCMVCSQEFHRCPAKEERDSAMSVFLRSPLLGCRATARSQALIEVVTELWRGSLTMSDVESRQEFLDCEVQLPAGLDAILSPTFLKKSSHQAVIQRADVSCSRFTGLSGSARHPGMSKPGSHQALREPCVSKPATH